MLFHNRKCSYKPFVLVCFKKGRSWSIVYCVFKDFLKEQFVMLARSNFEKEIYDEDTHCVVRYLRCNAFQLNSRLVYM